MGLKHGTIQPTVTPVIPPESRLHGGFLRTIQALKTCVLSQIGKCSMPVNWDYSPRRYSARDEAMPPSHADIEIKKVENSLVTAPIRFQNSALLKELEGRTVTVARDGKWCRILPNLHSIVMPPARMVISLPSLNLVEVTVDPSSFFTVVDS